MEKLTQHLAFVVELDKLKAVYRQTRVLPDNNRRENSAEHSWHIALMAHVLQEYVSEPVNINRVTSMLLIHDVVEIDAGDTFAFAATSDIAGQEARELKALDRLFGLLPDEQYEEYKQLWLEFEQAQSVDARFAKAMDRLLPFFQNMTNQGGSWVEHGISREQVLKRNSYLQGLCPELWDYVTEQADVAVANGWLSVA